MGQAKSMRGMLFLLLLACNHERVDLGEPGASGSAPPMPSVGTSGFTPRWARV